MLLKLKSWKRPKKRLSQQSVKQSVSPPTEDPRKEVGVVRVYASTMGHETAKVIIATAAPRAGTAGAWKMTDPELSWGSG